MLTLVRTVRTWTSVMAWRLLNWRKRGSSEWMFGRRSSGFDSQKSTTFNTPLSLGLSFIVGVRWHPWSWLLWIHVIVLLNYMSHEIMKNQLETSLHYTTWLDMILRGVHDSGKCKCFIPSRTLSLVQYCLCSVQQAEWEMPSKRRYLPATVGIACMRSDLTWFRFRSIHEGFKEEK